MNRCNNCAKRRDVQKECPCGGTYHHRGEHGERIGTCNAYRKETNADRIRAMSDEELADQLVISLDGLAPCKMWAAPATGKIYLSGATAARDMLTWLQQTAPEEGEQK